MRKKYLIYPLYLFLFCIATFGIVFHALSQKSQIKGAVWDTVSHQPIHEASLVILNAKDSFLVADSRSKKDGTFTFNNIHRGKYLLLITFPEYIDFVEPFSIDTSLSIDFQMIKMTLKAHLLEEVTVGVKRPAIRIKGDTTEYVADSFRVSPNASVEDLLKRLPGLQVDRNGNIKANGRSIEKVLVDGEEFFGDDPTLITRNLKANMIDKVQLYDKTSDQAAFTGINDGKKTKTLDLKLKESKKNGYFGKVELGMGTNGFYQNQAMYNSFRGKRKLAGYFIFSNTGIIGLDRNSQQSYAGGDNNPISNDLDTWNGTYSGIGIPKSISGGLHYDDKWNEDKQAININYKLGGLDMVGSQNTTIQNNIPGDVLYSSSSQKVKNHMLRQGLNISYSSKLDSSSTLKISTEGSILDKTTHEQDSTQTKGKNLILLNSNARNIATNDHIKALRSNILWEKKFNKPRRTVSLNFNTILNNNNSTGDFYTVSNFFNTNNNPDSTQLIDQYKTTNNHAESYGLKAVYTEPLTKWGSLIVNYRVLIDNASAKLNTYNRIAGVISAKIDSLYSNEYQFNQFSNRTGLAYIYNRKKIRFQFGNDIAFNKLDQENLFYNSKLQRSFINWYPNAQFSYNFSSEKSIALNYNGNTSQPSIQQLQPALNNNDPLNIFVGNPDLNPTFSNNLSISYYRFKGGTSLFANGSISVISSPITTSVQTDSLTGKSINTFVNLKGRQTLNYSGSVLYRGKLKLWNLDWGFDGNIDGNKYINLTNDIINITKENTYKVNFILSKIKDTSYNVSISFSPSFNTNKNSLQTAINNNSWGYNSTFSFDFYFPNNFLIQTDGDYTWQGKTQTFNNNFSRFIWNAWVGKKILKGQNLLIKLSANDILNQNLGFRRSVSNNIITQNIYNSVSRFFLASIIWDFNKTSILKK